jgi:predicted TIM-barrel fold metal-dependent hydrolase
MLLKYSHPFLLDELAHRHPDLAIIAAHVGAPWIIETIAIAARHPNVYLDISALPAIRKELVQLALALCVERGMEDRVLFGSDFPVLDPSAYARAITGFTIPAPVRWALRLPKLSEAFKKQVLGENTMRLLRLPE